MNDDPTDTNDNDLKKEPSSKNADLHGTLSDGDAPPKKIKLFFSRKIWVTVISFIALTVIGGIIEFTVQTPISKYIEKLTGPRVRTLEKQIKQGNHEFVYRSIKSKFHDEPYDKDYAALYKKSSEGFLRDLIKEHEWDKASHLIREAVEGMPVSNDYRLSLRRIYMAAQPVRFRLFKQLERGQEDASERLYNLWKETELLALKDADDPLVQFEAGKTLAELNWVGNQYNLESLTYFKRVLELDPAIKNEEIVHAVFDQALGLYPGNSMSTKAMDIIQTYCLEEYKPALKNMLKPYPFTEKQTTEEDTYWNKRINAFHILSNTDNCEPVDTFCFYLMTLAHLRSLNEETRILVDRAKNYFNELAASNKFKKTREAANLPRIVPAGILTEDTDTPGFLAVWPLISSRLASIFEGYCHEKLFYEQDIDLQKNCYNLLKKTGKLTAKEQQKWQDLGP